LRICQDYDERVAKEMILPEDRRRPRDAIILDRVNMNEIISMALTNRKIIEYNQLEDPYMLSKDNLVKITGKSKKQQAKLESKQSETERQQEI